MFFGTEDQTSTSTTWTATGLGQEGALSQKSHQGITFASLTVVGNSALSLVVLRRHKGTVHLTPTALCSTAASVKDSEVATNHNQDQLPRQKGCMGYPTQASSKRHLS